MKSFAKFIGVHPNFSVAHPSARPNGWHESFKRAVSNSNDFIDYVLSVDERFGEFRLPKDIGVDFGTVDLTMSYLSDTKRKCFVDNVNNAIHVSSGEVILVSADDVMFPANWTDELAKLIGDRDPLTQPFAIHVNDGSPRADSLMTHPIFSRALMQHWGYAIWPEYESLYMDDDFTAHAYQDPAVEVLNGKHLLFEHMHFTFGKSQNDAVYQHENRPQAISLGQQVYNRRVREGFKVAA